MISVDPGDVLTVHPLLGKFRSLTNYTNIFQVVKSHRIVSLTTIPDRVAESAEQDQTAPLCRLILLYTLHKINPWLLIPG